MARQRDAADETQSEGYRQRASLRRLWPELRPFLGLQLLCAALTISQSAFGFIPPKILGDIVNQLQRGEPINAVAYLLWVVGFAVGQGLLGYALGVSTATLGQRFLIATRQKLYRHMQSLPLAFFEKNQTGKLGTHAANEPNGPAVMVALNNHHTPEGAGQQVDKHSRLLYLLNRVNISVSREPGGAIHIENVPKQYDRGSVPVGLDRSKYGLFLMERDMQVAHNQELLVSVRTRIVAALRSWGRLVRHAEQLLHP